MQYANHNILITGCSSGIGLCVAHGLKQRGYRVIASARKSEDVSRLQAEGYECVQLDLDDSASIDQALAHVWEKTQGKLYGLFNNGAYGLPGAVEDLSRDALRAQFETNVLGWLELTNKVIPYMRRQGYGRIIQNSSVLGLVAFPYRGAYVASKFAIEGLTDTLRLELAGSGIQVSLIEPGPIRSRFRENALTAYKTYIDPSQSVHKQHYVATEKRLRKKGPAMPFTLPPEAILKRVIHALESRKPRTRYYVTTPSYIFAFLKRVLPFSLLDRLLIKASGEGSR